MATGYTYPVKDGKVTDLRTFALNCARAFGACIELRDDPKDTPIPEEFQPNTYHRDAMALSRDELARLEAMGADDRRALYDREREERETMHRNIAYESAISAQRYRAMIEKVSVWQPPSTEHAELKAFMLQQLNDSIKHDGGGFNLPPFPPFEEWWGPRVEAARDAVARHEEGWRADIARAEGRTRWMRKLRESLK